MDKLEEIKEALEELIKIRRKCPDLNSELLTVQLRIETALYKLEKELQAK